MSVISNKWKEGLAVLVGLVGAVVSVLSLSDKLSPPIRAGIVVLCMFAACLYVWAQKTPSSMDSSEKLSAYPRWARTTAVVFAVATAVYGFTVWPLWVRSYYFSPLIKEIRPELPVKGMPLQIRGERFGSDPAKLDLYFGQARVANVLSVAEDRIDLLVPETANSGPLRLNKSSWSSWFPPRLFATYAVLRVRSQSEEILLINESMVPDPHSLQVRFSVLNPCADRKVTLSDLTLNVLLVERTAPNLVVERTDLGKFMIQTSNNLRPAPIASTMTSLLNKNLVVKLSPGESESFSFQIVRPDTSLNLRMLFVLSSSFYDDLGNKSSTYSDQLYRVLVDDLHGFSLEGSLPFNKQTIATLQKQYGTQFEIVGNKQ